MGVWEILSHAVHDVMSGGLKVDAVGGSPPLTFYCQMKSCSDSYSLLCGVQSLDRH